MAVVRAEGRCRRAGSLNIAKLLELRYLWGFRKVMGFISYNKATSKLFDSVSTHPCMHTVPVLRTREQIIMVGFLCSM